MKQSLQDRTLQNRTEQRSNRLTRAASLAGGGLLLLFALKKRSLFGLIAGLVGADLASRGAAGQSLLQTLRGRTQGALEIEKSVIVNLPQEDVYSYWRNLENLPTFMDHVHSVQMTGNGRSHWVVQISPGLTLGWDAEITEDRPHERIAWQSLPEASVQHSGAVHFAPAPGNRGTEVTVTLAYQPPAGVAGEAFERLHKIVTAQQIKEDLRRFKQMMEAGETPTIEGQPVGPQSSA